MELFFREGFLLPSVLFVDNQARCRGDEEDAEDFVFVNNVSEKDRRQDRRENGFHEKDQGGHGHGIGFHGEEVAGKAQARDEDGNVEKNEDVV